MRKGNKKNKKAKLAPGGWLKENEEVIGQGGQAAGLLGSTIDPMFKETNVAGKTGTGALKGAAAGTAILPGIGTAVGALVGGVTGFIGAKKAKKEEDTARLEQQRFMGNANLSRAFDNAGNQFEHGGKLLAKKLNTKQGGHLKAISDDAVEVKANNPAATDSVELDNAFVDHNEVIDRKNRVYSDSVFLPNGKSVAKEAKKLEKMKAEDYEKRFTSANKHIDSKLDNLFAYQESTKPQTSNQKLAFGGMVEPDPTLIGPQKLNLQPPGLKEYKQEQFKKFDTFYEDKMNSLQKAIKQFGQDSPQAQAIVKSYQTEDPFKTKLKTGFKKGGKLKPSYQFGTDNPRKKPFTNEDDYAAFISNNPSTFQPVTTVQAPKLDLNMPGKVGSPFQVNPLSNSGGTSSTATKSFGDKLQSASTALATFGPNLATSAFIKRLKGPKAPLMEQGVKLKRISPDAQLAAASQQTRQAQEIVRRSTAQGSDAVSAQGSLLARRLNANNEIYGAANNANAQIQAQEAGLNQSVRARNVERTNQFRDNQVEFSNKKQQLRSENIANLSSKILARGREKNIMKLDKEKFDILSKQYSDLPAELKVRYPTVFDYYNSKEKKKLGGKIQSKLTKKK